MDPKISIIIPAYNSARTLNRCLDSVVAQSFEDFEAIIINDGSHDTTLEIAKNYISDKRFIIIDQENKGVSEARNAGIEACRGEYITFLDSDDELTQDALKSLYASSESADLVIGGIDFLAQDGTNVKRSIHFENESFHSDDSQKIIKLFKSRHMYGPVAKLYKTSVVKSSDLEFTPNLQYGEDRLFNFHFMSMIYRIRTINKSVYTCHSTEASLSSKSIYELFDAEYYLWKEERKFFNAKYNGADSCLLPNLYWLINDYIFQAKKYKQIKNALSIPEIADIGLNADKITANTLIKNCILNRRVAMIYFITRLIKLCQK